MCLAEAKFTRGPASPIATVMRRSGRTHALHSLRRNRPGNRYFIDALSIHVAAVSCTAGVVFSDPFRIGLLPREFPGDSLVARRATPTSKKTLKQRIRHIVGVETREQLKDLILLDHSQLLKANHPNPLNRAGRRCFSATDEDGITLEILRRIGHLDGGAFAEFGVGDGIQNNTLILAALGWKGFWVGGQELAVEFDPHPRFTYEKAWITAENIVELSRSCLRRIDATELDVVSVDLDGNDIYLVEKLLTDGLRPKLFIVEYNGKFPPPVKFQIAYDPDHVWRSDDYFGASLSSYAALFADFDYRLVCCNAHSGSDAFFVEGTLAEHFTDVPTDIQQIYVEPRYFSYGRFGQHKTSPRTVARILGMQAGGR